MDLLNHLHEVYAQNEFGAPVLAAATAAAYERICKEFHAQPEALEGLLKMLDARVGGMLAGTPGNPMLDQIHSFVEYYVFPQDVGIAFNAGERIITLHECMPAYAAYASAKKWDALVANATAGIDDAIHADNCARGQQKSTSRLIGRPQVLDFVNKYGDNTLAAVCKRDDLTACTPHARDELAARIPALMSLEDAICAHLGALHAAHVVTGTQDAFWTDKSNLRVRGKEITYVTSCAAKQYKHYTHDKTVYIFYISEIGPCVIPV